MANIDTSFLERCILTLDCALQRLQASQSDSVDYELYRSACVTEFEIILEQSAKLLKKAIKPFFHTSKEVDKLMFKDICNYSVSAKKWMVWSLSCWRGRG